MKFAAASGKVTRASIRGALGASAKFGQHAVAEAMHVVDRALQGLRLAIAEQPHIDRGDAELLKPPDIPDPTGIAAGEQLVLVPDATARTHARPGEDPIGQRNLPRVAVTALAELVEALQLLSERRDRVHRVLRIRPYRIPALGIADGTAERRCTFPAHPDRNRLLHRLGREHDIVEAHILA